MATVSQTEAPAEFVSVNEAAEIIGVSDGRIRQLLALDVSAGGLDGFKINEKAWVIPRTEAERIRDNPSEIGRPRGSCDKE